MEGELARGFCCLLLLPARGFCCLQLLLTWIIRLALKLLISLLNFERDKHYKPRSHLLMLMLFKNTEKQPANNVQF